MGGAELTDNRGARNPLTPFPFGIVGALADGRWKMENKHLRIAHGF
jgi:hypothetical protein